MNYLLRFAHPSALYIGVPILLCALVWRLKMRKSVYYRYSLATAIKNYTGSSGHPFQKVFFIMRVIALGFITFLLAKPQLVDTNSKIKVQGIDIVLAIDVSGSMQIQDEQSDERTRVEIAKAEAIRFIDKRNNDAIGLVIFAQDAVTRCPLTLDKRILKEIVHDLSIGVIDQQGTVLATALINAINRLKNSKSKSKIIILLTDGEPSENDIDPAIAIEAAQKLGIKIYTVGIGSEKPVTMSHPFYGTVIMPAVNADLLKNIAQQTGGKFFLARNAKDMRTIYDTIDTLEKTEIQAPVFSTYWDIFIPFVCIVLALILLEIILSSLVWFSICN